MNVEDLPDDGARTVAATETSFRLLEALKRLEGAGVTELATELSMTKSTVHKHLTTLRRLGYVVKEGATYRLAVGFLGLGVAARTRLQVYEPAREPLAKLAEATDEIASLVVPEHGRGVYVHQVVPSDAASCPIHEGERVPLHETASGKAILAYTPPEERERIFDYHGPDPEEIHDELSRELQRVRDSRTAYDRGGYVEDRYCIAAPITDANRNAIASIAISGPADRMAEKFSETDIPNFIGSTANSIQNHLRPE